MPNWQRTMHRLLAFALVAAITLTGAPKSFAQVVEDHRFCSSTAANIVLYLDVTTPYDAVDETSLVSGISQVFDSLEGGARFSIRTIEEAFSSSDRLLDMCVPYCESRGFLADLFSECTEGVVINEKKRLRAAVREVLARRLRDAAELPNSEIVRTLSLSAVEEYRPARPNRIFIFSDMIENSPYMTGSVFFGTATDALIMQLVEDKLIPDLLEADVRVFGFGRTGVSENRDPLPQERVEKIRTFWTTYFAAAGATLKIQQNLSIAN